MTTLCLHSAGGKDLYVFLHGRDYRGALQDFVACVCKQCSRQHSQLAAPCMASACMLSTTAAPSHDGAVLPLLPSLGWTVRAHHLNAAAIRLAGATPLKPWRTHGVWFSREYPFSRPEITDVISGYADRQLPLNVLVLDYQWHYGPGDVQDVAGCNQVSLLTSCV